MTERECKRAIDAKVPEQWQADICHAYFQHGSVLLGDIKPLRSTLEQLAQITAMTANTVELNHET